MYFQADDSSKKQTNEFIFSAMMELFRSFFWKNLRIAKSPFEINWPLLIHFFPRWLILGVTFDFDMFCFCFFRLLTLFRMKKRFRDVFGVTVILMPRLISAVVVLYLIYYFFAIIGMECFGHLSLENCCKNTTVEQFYANDSGN